MATLFALVGAALVVGWLVVARPAAEVSPAPGVRGAVAPPLSAEAARLARSALAVFRYEPRNRR